MTRGRPRGVTINPTALDDLLVARGMSRATLAKRADISARRLSDIERGTRVSVEIAGRIASALHVYPATLFPELTRINGGTFRFEADQ